jgi:thiamine biosynthesis protein ThiS
MNILINGEKRQIIKQFNLFELLQEFNLPTERVAIELNQQVVRKKDWENIQIKDADKLEIVHFVGGG